MKVRWKHEEITDALQNLSGHKSPKEITCLLVDNPLQEMWNNNHHQRYLCWFSLYYSDWKFEVEQALYFNMCQHCHARASKDKSRTFSGNFKQVELKSWNIYSNNYNRRWKIALPKWSWRQSIIKPVATKKQRWFSKTRRDGCRIKVLEVGECCSKDFHVDFLRGQRMLIYAY